MKSATSSSHLIMICVIALPCKNLITNLRKYAATDSNLTESINKEPSCRWDSQSYWLSVTFKVIQGQ